MKKKLLLAYASGISLMAVSCSDDFNDLPVKNTAQPANSISEKLIPENNEEPENNNTPQTNLKMISTTGDGDRLVHPPE